MIPPLRLLLIAAILVPTPILAEEPLGRLFHTPQERRALDRLRAAGATNPGKPAQSDLRLDGVIRKSDGKTTVWISGRQAAPGSVESLDAPQAASIPTPKGGRVRLRVGEALTPGEDTPVSPLGNGHARRDAR